MRNKRGEIGEPIGLEETIFLIFNIVFFFVVLTFTQNAGSRAFVYEESYAKQIVSAIDNAQPDMQIIIDVSKGLKIGRENGMTGFFELDGASNRVNVRLSDRGYSYQYFSGYEVILETQDNSVFIKIGDKDG